MSGEIILAVDHKPNSIHGTRLYLERAGFEMISVGEGEAATRAASEDNPGLTELEIMLPETEGLEVFRRLLALDNTIKFTPPGEKAVLFNREIGD